MTKYHTTILNVRLTDAVEKVAKTFEQNFGAVKSYPIRRELLKQIKADLLRIMTDAVDISLKYFYAGRQEGDMARNLRRGIQVKGQSLSTVSAILHGLDYTTTHEENKVLKPENGKMLAIPLPDACYSDGRPKMSSPDRWKSYGTFLIKGSEALNTYNRTPAYTQINPFGPEQVYYIVYKGESGNLVFLYKLVPHSYFFEGYTNYKKNPLKKLGLRQRIVAGISSAAPGWDYLVWNLLESVQDFSDLRCYKDINIGEVIEKYSSSYSKDKIPKGRVNWDMDKSIEEVEGVALMTYKALTA